MSESMRAIFDKLPVYWKLITARCLLYTLVAGCTSFISGLDGYTGWQEISWFTLQKLMITVFVDMAMVIIAFLDNSIKSVAPKDLPDGGASFTTTTLKETKVTLPSPTDASNPPLTP